MSAKTVTKPCDDCGEPVEDHLVTPYCGPWTCYWCHCQRNGIDVKQRLNSLITAMKLGYLVYKDPDAN